jgi:hypothetical protein
MISLTCPSAGRFGQHVASTSMTLRKRPNGRMTARY